MSKADKLDFCSNADFNDPKFSAVDFLDSQFSDEQSLGNLDGFLADLQDSIKKVDESLLGAVKAQSVMGSQVGNDLNNSKAAMGLLFTKVVEIKDRASHSETMINEICHDIRALDNAKRNITLSIKSVQWLQELESGVSRLQKLCDDNNYKEAGPLLQATTQLFSHFEDKTEIPSLQQLAAQFNAIRSQLTNKIMETFPSYDPSMDGPPSDDMAAACLGIDAIGEEGPRQFVKTFIQNQLDKYQRKFHRGEASAQLSNTDKRYQWFRRYLQALNEHCSGVFPAEWCLPQEMAVEFCLLTNGELSYQLQAEAATLDVVVLVKAWQKSLDFEKDLSNRWQSQVSSEPHGEEYSSDEEADSQDLPEQERIKQKYLRHARQRQRAERREQRQRESGVAGDAPQYKFHGFITSCFEQSVQVYVDYEGAQMRETVETLVAEESWGSSAEDGPVGASEILTSASDLFIYVEESLKRSSALSRGTTLFKMHEVWCKYLSFYADKLSATLTVPKCQDVDRDRVTCIIINTADYWSVIITQLTDEIKAKIEEISRSEVNLDAAADSFSALINKSIRTLIRSIESKMEPCFADMLKTNWGLVSAVDDQSAYVNGLCTILADKMKTITLYLNTNYVRLFCNKFVVYFMRRLLAQFYKCKRISEPGCQQLLLDLQTLRVVLQDLPNDGNPERFSTASLASYTKLLTREVKKAENVLKIIMSPPSDKNLLTDYAELVQHPSIPDFSKLMELKGLKKAEITPLLEQLGQNKKVAKTEYVYPEEDLDLQPQDLGAGSVFTDWKKKLGGSIKISSGKEFLGTSKEFVGTSKEFLGTSKDLLASGKEFLGRT